MSVRFPKALGAQCGAGSLGDPVELGSDKQALDSVAEGSRFVAGPGSTGRIVQGTDRQAAQAARLAAKMGRVRGAVPIGSNESMQRAKEDAEFLRMLVGAYYPVDHPQLSLVEGKLDLSKLGRVGRKDETGRLRKVVLSVPYALDGDWKYSPLASKDRPTVDLDRALRQHAALTRFLLDRGVEVHLTLQPPGASEAVYATDTLTGLGSTVLIGNPKWTPRQLETDKYEGGVRLAKFGGSKGPIEFGDVILFEKNGRQYVFQGLNSMRSTDASIVAMRRALEQARRRLDIGDFVHVPVRLAGDDTLHLDYVFNYAGTGDRRVMTICPEALADPSMVGRLAEILEVPTSRVITVDKEEMLAGAANLSSFDENEVLYIDSPKTDRVAQAIEAHGLRVTRFAYDQMSQKDGTLHCSIGQLARD